MICRFNGNTTCHYSVAEHSLWVESKVSNQFKKQALMHDASEAYIADIMRPIKKVLPGYNDLEEAIMMAIASKYGFDWPMSPEVKEADDRMLMTEKRDLILKTDWDWGVDYVPYDDIIVPSSQVDVKNRFMKRFEELFPGGLL
jgi:5'-deoxynucleotidase YfbR-like HD superfamily hydrolase